MKHTYRSGKANVILLGTMAGIVLLGLLAFFLIRLSGGEQYQALPVSEFAAQPKSFAGNTYQLESRIDSQLGYDEAVGKVLLTRTLESGQPVPVFVPVSIGDMSAYSGQVYRFTLTIDGDGVLVVEKMQKI